MKIGVLIAHYNKGLWLTECLQSVINQTYRNWQVALVDDHSPFQNWEAGKQFIEDKDARIAVGRHLENQGVGATLNSCVHLLNQINYPYDAIIQVDADDILEPQCFEKLVDLLQANRDCKVAYGNYKVFQKLPNGKITTGPGSRFVREFDPRQTLASFNCFHPRLINRDVFEYVGGYSALKAAVDYDLVLKLGEVTKFVGTTEILYNYRISANSISHSHWWEQTQSSLGVVKKAMKRRGLYEDLDLRASFQSKTWFTDADGNRVNWVALPKIQVE